MSLQGRLRRGGVGRNMVLLEPGEVILDMSTRLAEASRCDYANRTADGGGVFAAVG